MQTGVMARARAVAATVALLLCGSISLAACSEESGDRPEATPRDCQTSSLDLGELRPAATPRRAVQDLLLLPGETAAGDSPVRIIDVIEVADDRARVDVTIGSWDGGYELERVSGGWVFVAGVSCGEPLKCSDLARAEGTDAYAASLCFEQTD